MADAPGTSDGQASVVSPRTQVRRPQGQQDLKNWSNLEQAPEPTLASASRDAAIDQSLALDTFLDKCSEASQIPRRLIAKQDENCG